MQYFGSTLPDICEAAASRSQEMEDCEDHEAKGARPKVFKQKSSHKIKSSSADKLSTSKKLPKISIPEKIDDVVVESPADIRRGSEVSIESQVQSNGVLTESPPPDIVYNDSECSKSNTSVKNRISSDSSYESANEFVNKETGPEPVEVVEKEFKEDVCDNILDDYFFHNSQPISLLSCGVKECSGESCFNQSGDMIVRENLNVSSHPKFNIWQCSAYIPSHVLFEIRFDSHGPSLSASSVMVRRPLLLSKY